MLLLEPKPSIRRLGLIASGGIGTRVALWLRLASLPGVVEYCGQPFMAAGTRLPMRAAGSCILQHEIAALSAMNAESGTARAFARTVHDVISWRGQSRQFLQGAYAIPKLPPITLFWGDTDWITPIEDALVFVHAVEGAGFERFEGCGHYLHHERPEALALKLREFLDAPTARAVRLPPRAATGEQSRQETHWASALFEALPWQRLALPKPSGKQLAVTLMQ